MRTALIAVFIIAVLVLSGCGTGTNRNGQQISEKDYRTGTKGLELEFLPNSPPDKVYSGSDLDFNIQVKNVGAYPDTSTFDGKLEVYGFDKAAFFRSGWVGGNFLSRELQGRSQYSPQGGMEVKQFHIQEVNTLFGAEFYDPTIIAAACYKYQTIAETKVCIDPDPYTVFDEKKVCTIPSQGKVYSMSSQGAPVAVTKIEEQITGKNILFGITIRNVGGGKVVDENVRNDCPLSLDYNDIDRVMVTAQLPYDASPKCQPRGDALDPVRLDDSGTGYIFCTFKKPEADTAFETVLHVQVDYRYLDTIQKKLNIVNLER